MADGRHGREIELARVGDTGGGPLAAYLSVPAPGHGPGVLVIQEAWGLVDHIREVCDRLARSGFVALAPDLYRGEATSDLDTAARLMEALEIPRAIADLESAVEALRGNVSVDGSRVGCLGFCMGGQLALSAGAQIPNIGAVVDCYGVHPDVEVDLEGLAAPVLGVFAENDEFVPPEAARKLEDELRALGKRVHFNTYLGVRHGFLNDSRPEAFDAAMAAEAWNDILSFLRAELV